MADRGERPETTSTITDADWYGEDLTDREAERVLYRGCDLTETTSTGGLIFIDCTFRDVRFNASAYANAAFLNCTFANCVFFGATFTGCKLLGSRFERCTFDQFVAVGGDWSFVALPGLDLRRASFTRIRMREADLTGARCSGGVLREVDLSGAALDRADFDRCDLRGSDLSSLDPLTVSLHGAIVDWNQAIVIAAALGLDVRPE